MEGNATPTPTYKVSTYSEVQKDIASAEPLPPVVDDVVSTPETVVAETTQVENIADQPQEENVSTFNISVGEDVPVAEPTPTAPQPTTFNWKDEIKKVDLKELLKEAGVSELAIEIDGHLKNGGKAMDYLSAKAINYNEIPDENIIKDNLKKTYPTFTPQQVDLMFNRKYGVSEDMSDEDREFVQLQLKADAHGLRQNLISEQQKFKIQDTPITQLPQDYEAYEQWKKQQESQPAALEKLSHYYNEHEATKALNESKRVTINLGDGVAPFHFAVDRPELITRILSDDGTLWNKLTSTQAGEPDVPKQQLLALIAANPQQFVSGIFNYGLSMGKKKLVEEGQNAQRPQAVIASMGQNQTATYRVGKYGEK